MLVAQYVTNALGSSSDWLSKCISLGVVSCSVLINCMGLENAGVAAMILSVAILLPVFGILVLGITPPSDWTWLNPENSNTSNIDWSVMVLQLILSLLFVCVLLSSNSLLCVLCM